MGKRTVLSLIEQTVMICVFAVAAALCLSVFVYARSISVENEIRDFGVRECANTAQILKSCAGDYEKAAAILETEAGSGEITLGYKKDYSRTDENPAYILRVAPAVIDYTYIGGAVIEFGTDEETVYSLSVSWQEAS